MNRTPIRRRYRDTGPGPLVRRLVLDRDGWCCVICGARTTQLHHRKPRGRGGGNNPTNLIVVCGSGTTSCHGWIESRRAESYDHGYLVRSADDPAAVPVHYIGVGSLGVYYLTDDGRREPAPHVEEAR